MQINTIGHNSPNFGMKCPAKVKEKLMQCMTSDGRAFFKNNYKAAETVDSIGSSSTRLSEVKFLRDIWDNGEGGGVKDICVLTYKLNSPDGKVVKIRKAIESYPEFKKDLFRELFKTTKNAEREFIDSFLSKSAAKGELELAACEIKEMYKNHKGFIAHRTKQLSGINAFAQDVKKQAVTIKDYLIKLFT